MQRNDKGVVVEQSEVKNICNQPKPANEQVQMRQNTLGVIIEEPQAQKWA